MRREWQRADQEDRMRRQRGWLRGDDRLLPFTEVERRLRLGTRLAVGRHDVPIEEIVGSVNRADDFDTGFRPTNRRLRKLIDDLRAAHPDIADLPIQLIQVDHAYFVEDGHKRLAIAAAAGRRFVSADVDRYETRFHLAPGASLDDVEATHAEVRFREVTGLDHGVPAARFPMTDPSCFLELAESVKAHAYDLSRDQGLLVPPPDAARHWYEVVFVPAVAIARGTAAARLLDSTTDADLFLIWRHGMDGPMDPGWNIPSGAVATGRDNLDAATPGRLGEAVRTMTGRRPRGPRILDDATPTGTPPTGTRPTGTPRTAGHGSVDVSAES